MLILVDFASEKPIYMQIYEQIVLKISNGSLQPGEGLPSVRRLSEDIGVNIHTVNKTYALLREEGYVKMNTRSGASIELKKPDKQKLIPALQEKFEILSAQAAIHGISEEEFIRYASQAYDQVVSNKERENTI